MESWQEEVELGHRVVVFVLRPERDVELFVFDSVEPAADLESFVLVRMVEAEVPEVSDTGRFLQHVHVLHRHLLVQEAPHADEAIDVEVVGGHQTMVFHDGVVDANGSQHTV